MKSSIINKVKTEDVLTIPKIHSKWTNQEPGLQAQKSFIPVIQNVKHLSTMSYNWSSYQSPQIYLECISDTVDPYLFVSTSISKCKTIYTMIFAAYCFWEEYQSYLQNNLEILHFHPKFRAFLLCQYDFLTELWKKIKKTYEEHPDSPHPNHQMSNINQLQSQYESNPWQN